MYMLDRSHGDAWRVFVPFNPSYDRAREVLRARSAWGGADKELHVDGMLYLGYEFLSLDDAVAALKEVEALATSPTSS